MVEIVKLVEVVEKGYTIKDAADAAGVKYSTMFAWIAKGKIPEPKIKFGRRQLYGEKEFKEVVALINGG